MGSLDTMGLLGNSFIELAEHQPIEKISVSDIVAASGKNRKTFYYHFESKDELIRWVFGRDLADVLKANVADDDLLFEPEGDDSFPSLPYCKNKKGCGPAWANSLFEDNAEFGFGMRMAVDANRALLKQEVETILASDKAPADLKDALNGAMSHWDNSKTPEAVEAQNKAKAAIAKALEGRGCEHLKKVSELSDYFCDKSVWIVGGVGWANDIGYGGIDHVLAQGKHVNILVLDTEVYSNTGGQASKSTPTAAVAKFAAGGKKTYKKNMGFMSMSYGYVYVASVAMGADRNQTMKAFLEAEAYNGPSIIFAYAPCIAHGIDMSKTQTEEKRAVDCGYYPLYRYNPANETPFTWDVKTAPNGTFQDFIRSEGRYKALLKANPAHADELYKKAEADAAKRMEFYQQVGALMK